MSVHSSFATSGAAGVARVGSPKLQHQVGPAQDLLAKAADLARSLESGAFFSGVSPADSLPGQASSVGGGDVNASHAVWARAASVGPERGSAERSSPPLARSTAASSEAGGVSGLKQFSYEYVTRLQSMHQERLTEALEASSRLLQAKEAEMSDLAGKVQTLQEQLTLVETKMAAETNALVEERDRLRRDSESHNRDVEETLASERQRMATELDATKTSVQQELVNIKTWAEQAVRVAEAERDAASRALTQQTQQNSGTEEAAANRLREMEASHQSQVAELQRLLNNETERLTLAREEICELSMSRGKELMEVRSKLEVTERKANQFRQEARVQLDKLVGEFRDKEKDYADLVSSLRHQMDTERQHTTRTTEELSIALRTAEDQAKKIEASADERMSLTQTEFSQLNATLDAGQRMSARQQQQNQELVQMVKALQHENGMLRQEVSLIDGECKRLRQDNVELRTEIERADRLIYGAKSSRRAH